MNLRAVGGGDAVPSGNLSLNLEEVKPTYVEYGAKGGQQGNVEMGRKVEEGVQAGFRILPRGPMMPCIGMVLSVRTFPVHTCLVHGRYP